MEIGLSDEELPSERSGDVESAVSGIPESENAEHSRPQVVTTLPVPTNFIVTGPTTNLYSDQETLRATRIIIHDPGSLLNPPQTITFNPLNRSLSVPEKHFNWDPSVYENVLPVRCRNVKGELYKNRFGSGSKGRSILVNDRWYTPSEFEQLCGRGNSKDWKRSIRYAGRTLMCLIDEGILRPHATSCTCGTCCDDAAETTVSSHAPTTGPVRLFTPYKRRKRGPKLKITNSNLVNVPTEDTIESAPVELQTSVEAVENGSSSEVVVPDPLSTETTTTIVIPESVIVTPAATPQTPRCAPTALDFSEQKQWWQLEEMVKNAVKHVLDLQKQVESVKSESAAAREAALKQLRIQMENEKKEALNACRLEAQVVLQNALLKAKTEREAAVEKIIQQMRSEMKEVVQQPVVENSEEPLKRCANCNREAFSDCAGCHGVSYCSPFCHQKDWEQHREKCGELMNDEGSDLEGNCNPESTS